MSLQVTLSPGTTIGGHYIVGTLLNSGGFGAVYQGIDISEGNRPCAIKETYDVTPAARRQALMETSVLMTVRNKHLPEVYDAFEASGRFYLIMQLIEGQNLLQLLTARVSGVPVGEAQPNQQSSGPCSEQEVLNWLLPIMDVLQDLHSRNPPILHRDIKPGNLILTPQQTVVLVDFGLTKLYDPTRTTHTMVKAVTVGFSPLEQYMGQTSPQSDIYSMAATMYLLLTNRLPSAAVSRSMGDDLIMPHLLNPLVSPHVERALLQALAVNANQRYQSMSEFAQALRAPAFTAYGDKTVAVVMPIVQNPQTQIPPTVAASRPTSLPPSSYEPVQATKPAQPVTAKQSKPPKKKGSSRGQQQIQPTQPHPDSYPILPLGTAGYGARPQAQRMNPPAQRARSLPNPFGIGCLSGVLLGIGSALLVWSSQQVSTFYLAFFVVFIGCMAAGFFATWRGGNVLRGGRAGYWTGLTSLLFFGTTFGIFLLIDFFQKLPSPTSDNASYSQNVKSAWNAVLQQHPLWPDIVILPGQQPGFLNFVAVLIAIVCMAWLLGLIGGILGFLQKSGHLVHHQQQNPHP